MEQNAFNMLKIISEDLFIGDFKLQSGLEELEQSQLILYFFDVCNDIHLAIWNQNAPESDYAFYSLVETMSNVIREVYSFYMSRVNSCLWGTPNI